MRQLCLPFLFEKQKLPSLSVFGLQRKPSKLKYICAPLQGFGELSSCVFLLCKLSTVRHLFQKQKLPSVDVFGLQLKLSKPKYMCTIAMVWWAVFFYLFVCANYQRWNRQRHLCLLFQKQNLSSVSVFGLQQKLSKPKYMLLENIWKCVKSDETMDGRTVQD